MPRTFLLLALALSIHAQDAPVAPLSVPVPRVNPAPTAFTSGPNGDLYMDSPSPFTTTGVLFQAHTGFPNIVAKLGTANDTAAFRILNSSNTELLRVRGDGTVGIGTTTPTYALDIVSPVNGVRITGNPNTGSVRPRIQLDDTAGAGSWLLQPWVTAGDGNFQIVRNGGSGNVAIPSGKLGIGTTNPSARLEIQGSQGSEGIIAINTNTLGVAYMAFAQSGNGTTPFYIARQGSSSTNNPLSGEVWNAEAGALRFGTSNTERVRIDAAGNVGIGTVSPTQKLHVAGQNALIEFNNAGTSGPAIVLNHSRGSAGSPSGVQAGDYAGSVLFGGYTTSAGYVSAGRVDSVITGANANGVNAAIVFQPATVSGGSFEALRITEAGSVGIGKAIPTAKLDVAGDIRADGRIYAKYQDVAEWVPASEDLVAGTVVTLDPVQNNHVITSSVAYDTRVAGVVSAQPGIILGEAGDRKAIVATTGRVRVRVDATRSPIEIGDLLVASDTPGTAMRSEPITISGRSFHQPGTIIGKALEPLASGRGQILVLLTLQ